MPRPDAQDPLLPSLLDRLIDYEPDVSREPAWHRSQDISQLKQAVQRDLEALLNSLQIRPDLLLDAPDSEIAQSVLTYGLPDLTNASTTSDVDRRRLRKAVEEAIRRFEPRLAKVQVLLREPTGPFDRKLRMTVDALLRLDPTPEPVVFETEMESTTGKYEVQAVT